MKIRNILDFYGSQSRAGVSTSRSSNPQINQVSEPAQNAEAVKLSSSFDAENRAQAEKLDRIKNQVNSGTYKVSSEEVAKAFIKDLLA